MLEASGGSDSYRHGGQIQTAWNLFPHGMLTADAAYYDFEKKPMPSRRTR
jgi:hypothetical protein